jgi:integrase
MITRGISSTVLAALMGHESSATSERRFVRLFRRQRAAAGVCGCSSRFARREDGITGVSSTSMRYAFACGMIDRTTNSTVLVALMGHESRTITERRYALFDGQRADDQLRLELQEPIAL